jgi:hypothetical protein
MSLTWPMDWRARRRAVPVLGGLTPAARLRECLGRSRPPARRIHRRGRADRRNRLPRRNPGGVSRSGGCRITINHVHTDQLNTLSQITRRRISLVSSAKSCARSLNRFANMNDSTFSRLVEIDEVTRRLKIYRVYSDGRRQFYTETELPPRTVESTSSAYADFARELGENILIDSPAARRAIG